MIRRFLTPILIGIFLLFVGFLAYSRFVQKRQEPLAYPATTAPQQQIPAASAPNYVSTSTQPIVMGVQGGSIAVQNFYRYVVDSEEGMLILREKPEYALYYVLANSKFIIVIKRDPFEENFALAKADLLGEMLGVDMQDACKLSIRVDFQNQSRLLCPTPL